MLEYIDIWVQHDAGMEWLRNARATDRKDVHVYKAGWMLIAFVNHRSCMWGVLLGWGKWRLRHGAEGRALGSGVLQLSI